MDNRNSTRSIAWAAGFIDGEGCIQIQRHDLKVSASQKDTRPLYMLKNLFGGFITSQRPSGVSEWKISNKQAEQALSQLLPYLVVKKEQAMIALEHRKLIGVRGVKATSANLVQRALLVQELSVLKHERF